MKMTVNPIWLIMLVFVQDYFYNFETAHWVLDKDSPIPKLVFYDGIKKLYILFVLGVLMSVLFFRRRSLFAPYKKGLLIVLFSCVAVPLFISLLKATTHVPCPKDIQHYGGVYPYVTVFSTYPDSFRQTKNIKCYPAGHASGGFALMSLFFLFSRKRNKIIALIFAVLVGWTIGVYKMIIGDHFFSHTFISMVLSWLLILFIRCGVDGFYSYKCANRKAMHVGQYHEEKGAANFLTLKR
ncbi:MAG: phosphatase PAP2 family protein [Gammaproteobacteria bacterium]